MKQKDPRGGLRSNPGGRPLKDPAKGKRIKTAITLTPEHFEKTAGNRSGIIERSLDGHFAMLESFENFLHEASNEILLAKYSHEEGCNKIEIPGYDEMLSDILDSLDKLAKKHDLPILTITSHEDGANESEK